MQNKSFEKLEKIDNFVGTFFHIMLGGLIVLCVLLLILGFVICSFGDLAIGLIVAGCSIVIAVFGIIALHFANMLFEVLIDSLVDTKSSALYMANISAKCSELLDSKNNAKSAKPQEHRISFYLHQPQMGEYLTDKPDRFSKSIMNAMAFESEEEALKYADSKGLKIGEKWKVVKKDLIVPIE